MNVTERLDQLDWVVDHIKKHGKDSKKILIYVNYVLSTADIFEHLQGKLGEDGFDGPPCSKNRLVEMYSAATQEEDKKRVQRRISEKDGNLRVVIATVAFGMGIDIPDVDIVVQWGLPRSPLQYWQQAGRGGRDGRSALNMSYVFARSINLCPDKHMKEFAEEESSCLRYKLLSVFSVNDIMDVQLKALKSTPECSDECKCEGAHICQCPACQCCNICMKKCPCKVTSKLDTFLTTYDADEDDTN